MHLRNPSTGGKLEMPIEKQVLMTLKYLASQETTLQISHLFGVTEYAFLKHKNNAIDTIYENVMDRRWLLTPYRDNGNLTRAQVNYNKSLSSKRQVIERAFGLLKGRFRRLKYVNLKDLGRICRTIAASCILHNIAVLNNELEDMLEGDDDVADDNLVANLFAENDREGSLKKIRLTNQLNL
ncbi:Hypothetical predicted protein [Mytilus galloprovincialis]|uniref:DDE Tnp4 domain-containing protein n=1 Tax=Mytilus galloprovincialis TaxID=29158 RepID=A0A8B6DKE3_MYTGA|nr:Hypothetical predicted protein [Mytilus galloprovincialis]